jgi:SUN domain-containing protein 1/2
VKGITIGHVSRSLAYDIRTAPKNFELWGVDDNGHEFRGSLLLDGTYEIDGVDNLQEFSVATMKSQLYSQVLLKIISNHGHPNLTCLYRV